MDMDAAEFIPSVERLGLRGGEGLKKS